MARSMRLANTLLAALGFLIPASGRTEELFPFKADMSGLVVVLNASLTGQTIETTNEAGFEKKIFWQWKSPFLQAYEVSPGEIEVHLPGPVQSVRLQTVAGVEAYLQITPYFNENGGAGIEIKSWYGEPNQLIYEIISNLKDEGYEQLFSVQELPQTKALYFDTDNPYPGPFDPKPKPPPKP